MRSIFALIMLVLAGVGLSACNGNATSGSTIAADVAAVAPVVIDGLACQADLSGIKGLTVANAVRVATTPSCVAALNAAIAAGQSTGVIK